MTTKCHYDLGRYLLKQCLNACTQAEGDAFLIGCVEPDINLFTYLKGSLRCRNFCRGHNYPNMLPCIQSLLNKLTYSKPNGVVFYYRLGKLVHYLTDAFTYPHNAAFPGTLQEHVSYETMLEEKFLQKLPNALQGAPFPIATNLYHEILTKHTEYMSVEAGEETDIQFICRVVPAVVIRLHSSAPFAYAMKCAEV